MRQQSIIAFALFALILSGAHALAQNWPERPVKLVVPFGAGGNTDVVARIIAARFSDVFGQQFIVENRAGAAGVIGAEFVAHAPADGYTLLMATQPQITIAPLMSKTSYDPAKDFVPISSVGAIPFVLAVHRGLPVVNLAEFIDYVRRHPGQLSYAVTGFGSVNHLTMMLLLKRAELDMVPVAYKGGSGGLIDVIAGHVHAYFVGVSVIVPHAESNEVRLLAVTSDQRVTQLPQVPTLAESGFPDLRILLWTGLFAPAGTPRTIIDRISQQTGRALRDPSFAERLAINGIVPLGSTPEQFAATIAGDIAFWRDAIKTTGIREK
jgi:tripartite-type tricarboxylate transporter receptor subunit TctC